MLTTPYQKNSSLLATRDSGVAKATANGHLELNIK